MEVLALIRSKTRCLENFHVLGVDFLKAAEKGDLSKLPLFQRKRDSILKALALYDRKITEAIGLLSSEERKPELLAAAQTAATAWSSMVRDIISIDASIIQKIEEAKGKTLQEIAEIQKSRKLVGKFKSTWVSAPGEELDRKL